MRVRDAGDGFVYAIQIDINFLSEGGFGDAQAVGEVRFLRRAGNQDAEFFSAQGHGRRLGERHKRVKRAGAVAALLWRGSMLRLKRYAQSWNRRSAECWQKHAV